MFDRDLRHLMAAAALIASSGCGGSPITPPRIERAVAPTFAHLVHLQASSMGLAGTAPADFDASASCRKVGAGAASEHSGSGEWVCAIQWRAPGPRVLRDVYDLLVTTDGCYTATIEGESLAAPSFTAADGREVRNLLYAFEGCFDPA